MKYQKEIIKNLIKNKYYKIIIVYLLFGISIISIYLLNKDFITINTYKTVIGTINIHNKSLLSILWFFYQIIINIYITYSFLIYDTYHSMEFLILRENYNKLIKYKIIIIISLQIIYRTLFYIVTYLIYMKYIKINLTVLLINLLIHLSITIITIIFYKILKSLGIN